MDVWMDGWDLRVLAVKEDDSSSESTTCGEELS